MANSGGVATFRFGIHWTISLWCAFVAAALLLWGWDLARRWGEYLAWGSAYELVVLLPVHAIAVAFILWHEVMWARRGRVVLDDEAMTLTDWRGRRRGIPWASVRSLTDVRLSWWIRFRTDGGPRLMHASVRDRTRLVREIVSRAGLQTRQRNWLGAYYARPSSPSPPSKTPNT